MTSNFSNITATASSWLTAAARCGVVRKGPFQLICEAKVVDKQSARFVFENPVDPGYRLHQAVSSHRLIHAHCV